MMNRDEYAARIVATLAPTIFECPAGEFPDVANRLTMMAFYMADHMVDKAGWTRQEISKAVHQRLHEVTEVESKRDVERDAAVDALLRAIKPGTRAN